MNAADVADQLGCNSNACKSPDECWTRGGCARRYHPDPKGGVPRIHDSAAMRRCCLLDRECWGCEGPPSDPHHFVFRSDGGDDVDENLIPLCHHCHMLYHFGTGDDREEVLAGIRERIRERGENRVTYVIRKLGARPAMEFMKARYGYLLIVATPYDNGPTGL